MSLPLDKQCKFANLPVPEPEHRFAPPRRWRFDWCWPEFQLALEVDGGVFVQGRHTRGAGVLKDHEKLNAAAIAGWRVLRVTPSQVRDGSALQLVEKAIDAIQEREFDVFPM